MFEEDIFTSEGGGSRVYIKVRGPELEHSQSNLKKKNFLSECVHLVLLHVSLILLCLIE